MEERNWAIIRAYKAGDRAEDIAGRYGIVRQRVYQVLRAYGVGRRDSGAHARREREVQAIDGLMAKEGIGRSTAARALGLPVHSFDPSTTREDRAAVRFWKRVDSSGGPDACWPWTGPYFPSGYGSAGKGYPDQYAHRTAFILSRGRRPAPEKPCVLHSCDNPPCCNPKHLWEGTQADNSHDRDAKSRDRFSRGYGPVRRPGFKHSEETIEKMRRAWNPKRRAASRRGYRAWWGSLTPEQKEAHRVKCAAASQAAIALDPQGHSAKIRAGRAVRS